MTNPHPDAKATLPKKEPGSLYANLYLGFFVVLAVAFVPTLLDPVLVPRQAVLTLFLAVVWTLARDGQRIAWDWSPLLTSSVWIAWCTFFLLGIVATTQSTNLPESLYVLSKYGIEGLLLFTTALLLYLGKLQMEDLVRAITVFTAIVVAVAVFQVLMLLSGDVNLLEKPDRITGTIVNKNLLSGILLMAAPFVVLSFLESKRKWAEGILLVLMLLLVWLLQTRSVWLGFAVLCLCTAGASLVARVRGKGEKTPASGPSLRPYLLALAVLVVLMAGITVAGRDQFTRLFNPYSVSERIQIWKKSVQMLEDHPALGVGPGNWQVSFPGYGLGGFFFGAITQGERTFQRPHNDFLWVACEQGIGGLLAYLAMLGLGGVGLTKIAKQAGSKVASRASILLPACLAGYGVFAFFDFPMERIEHQVLLMVLLAQGMATSLKPRQQNSTDQKPATVPIFGIAAILILFSASAVVGRWQGEAHTRKLLKARTAGMWERVISEAGQAKGAFYTVDNTTIPVDWYAGMGWFTMGDYTKAKTAFLDARLAHPNQLHTLTNLGSCYEKLGDHATAMQLYRQALTISPGFEDALLNMAASSFNAGQTDSALVALLQVVDKSSPRYLQFEMAVLGRKLDDMLKAAHSLEERQRWQYLKDTPNEASRLLRTGRLN